MKTRSSQMKNNTSELVEIESTDVPIYLIPWSIPPIFRKLAPGCVKWIVKADGNQSK
jgi:hypothetical protein